MRATDQTVNEQLASVSNHFLEVLSKLIHKYGGDVIQFLGNSLIAVWPPYKTHSRNAGQKSEDELDQSNIEIARKAVQCALEIRNERLKVVGVNGGDIQIGVGFGDCGILHVGGVFKRVEYCLIGEGLS